MPVPPARCQPVSVAPRLGEKTSQPPSPGDVRSLRQRAAAEEKNTPAVYVGTAGAHVHNVGELWRTLRIVVGVERRLGLRGVLRHQWALLHPLQLLKHLFHPTIDVVKSLPHLRPWYPFQVQSPDVG